MAYNNPFYMPFGLNPSNRGPSLWGTGWASSNASAPSWANIVQQEAAPQMMLNQQSGQMQQQRQAQAEKARQTELSMQSAAQQALQQLMGQQQQQLAQTQNQANLTSQTQAEKARQADLEKQASTQRQATEQQQAFTSQQAAADRAFQFQTAQDSQKAAEALVRLQGTTQKDLAQLGGEQQKSVQQMVGEQALAQLARAGEIEREKMGFGAQLAKEAEERRLEYLPKIMASLPSMVTRSSSVASVPGGEDAARAALFAREKDRIGQLARAGVDTTLSVLGERGLLGGGYEAAALGDVVSNTQGQLGDVSREQAIQALKRASERADLDYQGQITQRAQNLNMIPALLGLLSSGKLY